MIYLKQAHALMTLDYVERSMVVLCSLRTGIHYLFKRVSVDFNILYYRFQERFDTMDCCRR